MSKAIIASAWGFVLQQSKHLIYENWWWRRDFYFFFAEKVKETSERWCAWVKWIASGWKKVLIWPYFVYVKQWEAKDAEINLQAHGGTTTAAERETWRAADEAGSWQRRGRRGGKGEDKRGSGTSPCTAQRLSFRNGTFPLRDMRSQNLVKWPLDNSKL